MSLTEIANRLKKRLPHTTQRLVSALGWEGALLFLQRNGAEGGRCVYIPIKYSPKYSVFTGMEVDAAERLIAEFGGQDIEFSGPKKMLASERYHLILQDYKERNFTIKMLCEKYRLPRQTVSWIIRDFH